MEKVSPKVNSIKKGLKSIEEIKQDLKNNVPDLDFESDKEETAETIQKNCLICQTIMVEPTQLCCFHRFCCQCIKHIQTKYFETVCPVCKLDIRYQVFEDHSIIDKKHQKKLQEMFPHDFKYHYEKYDRLNQLVSEMTHFEIMIGNTYRIINNPHDKRDKKSKWNTWKCFVRMSDPSMNKYLPFLIEKVHFKPYFREDIN
jgi:hypothetical protein